jgi:mercuric ion transport protein
MSRTWKQSLTTIPGVGLSLLPKLACPFCWPAYAGLLSSVGLGFLISARYLLPVTAAFLVVAVGALAFRADRRRGYGPFLLGLFAAVGVLVGKFWWESNPVVYAAVLVLVVASVWNAWPHRAAVSDCCAEKSIN